VPAKTSKQISKVTFNGIGAVIKSASRDARTGQQVKGSRYNKDVLAIQHRKKMKVIL
jgi:hypothetical protein